MIIADITNALRKHKYIVETEFINKEIPNQVYVVLGAFDPMLETDMTYLPEIEVDIIFYMTSGDEIIEQVKDIINIVHTDVILTNYHHFRFESVDIRPTNNDIEVTMVIKYRDVINLG